MKATGAAQGRIASLEKHANKVETLLESMEVSPARVSPSRKIIVYVSYTSWNIFFCVTRTRENADGKVSVVNRMSEIFCKSTSD